jgi:3-dehydroquinate dehydratase
MLRVVAIPGDRSVIKIEGEISNYEDFITEIQHMRNVKTEVIAVIMGATGTISKSPRLPEQHTGKARN